MNSSPLLDKSQESPKINTSIKHKFSKQLQDSVNQTSLSQADQQNGIQYSDSKDNQVQDTAFQNSYRELATERTQFQYKLEAFQSTLEIESASKQSKRKPETAPFDEVKQDTYQPQNDRNTYNIKEVLQTSKNAPKDATRCTKIQSLNEYVQTNSKEVRNPKDAFFDLTRKYYNSKYDTKDNKKTITVESYLLTKDDKNYVKDLSMDIITTKQGCMPIIKTYEENAYNPNRFVKALKFYNYRGNCEQIQKIIVDEGVEDVAFKIYDTSILMFENSIIFYKREDNWHKLYEYDVVKNICKEIKGYQIKEPTTEDIRYYLMFSNSFGEKKLSNQEQYKPKQPKTINEFVEQQFVFCQSFKINNDLKYENKEIVMFSLKNLKSAIHSINLNKEPDTLPQAIQYVCHTKEPESKNITFIAIDSFSSHQFSYNPGSDQYSDFTTYQGNNEYQMLKFEEMMENYQDSKFMHENLKPFYKHENGQFLIQQNKVELINNEKIEQIDQYYYITNDNQFMLIYPNYQKKEEKHKVILQIAQKHSCNQNPDIDYSYYDDYLQRQSHYDNQTYKKIAHVCSDNHRSKNHMKKSDHLIAIIGYGEKNSKNEDRKFEKRDKLVLSTDQERSNIYVYKSYNKKDESNKIEIYTYENNIAYSSKIMKQTPPQIVLELDLEEQNNYGVKQKLAHQNNTTYYISSLYRNVISSQQIIKTYLEDETSPTKTLNFKLEKNQKDEFILIEGANGHFQNIRVKQQTDCFDNITLQLYYKSKQFYIFVFSISQFENEVEISHNYFFVRKSLHEISELAIDNFQSVLDMNQEIVLIKENDQIGLERNILEKYLQIMKFKDLIEFQKIPQTYKIHLSFEPIIDNKFSLEFLPFIYQDQSSILTHYLLIFDITAMEINSRISINSNLNLRQLIQRSEQGFVEYTLTRTSDIFEQTLTSCQALCNKKYSGANSSQLAKYQIGSQYQFDLNDQKNQDPIPRNSTFELNEYLINFRCGIHTNIQLIGSKQFILSEEARIHRFNTFDKILILPYFDQQGHIKGSQLILKENEREQKENQVIYILDQDFNNIYHQNSELVQFGYQKFLTNLDNHQEYILVVSCQFKQYVYLNGNFENNEAYFILSKIQKKLLSMQLAKFEYFVLTDDFDILMRDEFYQAQEVLEGKTLCDICLSFPKEILIGLKQQPEFYQKLDGSLIDEISQGIQENINIYKSIGLCEDNLIVQLDFNFVSTLRLAMELHQNQSVKMLLSKVFELNSKDYKDIFMLELPIFLNQKLISRLYPFFERDRDEALSIQSNFENMYKQEQEQREFCNFEDFLNHPDLHTYSNKRVEYHIKTRFLDYHNSDREIIDNVVQKDPQMKRGIHTIVDETWSNSNQDAYQVEHSIIDFQKIVIGEKIRAFQESKFKISEFNDESLANLVNVEPDEHIEFFNLETVRKIIDFQFVRTRQFLEGMLKFYLIGFLIPFVLSISTNMLFVKNVSFIICFFTQFFFFIFEIKQVRRQGVNYLFDPWNWIDCSQFLFFITLFFNKMTSQFETDSFSEMILTSVLLFLSFYKVFYYIRIYDKFCTMITLQMKIAGDLFPFVSVVLFVMIAFAKMYQILHAGINDPTNQYSSIDSDFVKSMLQTYKGMGGEKVAPKVDDIMTERLEESSFALTLIFGMIVIVWICQQGFFGIIFTFFISLVSQSYEKHLQRMNLYHYKIKARFNVDNYQILDLFIKQRNFKAILFSIDKNLGQNQGDQWLGPSHAFKKMMCSQTDAVVDDKKFLENQIQILIEQQNDFFQKTLKSLKVANQNNQ